MTKPAFYHLGRETELSSAELEAIFGAKSVLMIPSAGVAKIEQTHLESPQGVLDDLGGVMKVSRLLVEIPTTNLHTVAEITAKWIEQSHPTGKIAFGLNHFPPQNHLIKQGVQKIKDLLKEAGRNGRFLNQGANLSTATIAQTKLLREGLDLNLIQKPDSLGEGYWLTQTVAVQDFASYSLRDYEKPARLGKEGMLPPKVAQLMINLTGSITGDAHFEGKTLYDPFCGSGTVLGEGLLKGMHVIGSDIDPKAIAAAEKNVGWIHSQFDIPSEYQASIFLKDAGMLGESDLKETPDMVVSELYLGPALLDTPSHEKILEIQDELSALYRDFLKAIHPLLETDTPLVLAIPCHYRDRKPYPMSPEKFLPRGYSLKISYQYHRPDQWVGREILVLKRD